MSSFLRPLVQHSTVAARRTPRQCASIRAFHSPFVALSQAQATHSQARYPQPEAQAAAYAYEKQYDFSYEPLSTDATFGNRIFVASQPDVSARHYKVPSGVYPVAQPFSSTETSNHGSSAPSTA